jgi:hypothetical protein
MTLAFHSRFERRNEWISMAVGGDDMKGKALVALVCALLSVPLASGCGHGTPLPSGTVIA